MRTILPSLVVCLVTSVCHSAGPSSDFPLALFVRIEPRWIADDSQRLAGVLDDISDSPFKLLINAAGTIGSAEQIGQYHAELSRRGLCEIVGLADYYREDSLTGRAPPTEALHASDTDEQAIRAVVREIGRHPTVAGWYIFDVVPENAPRVAEHFRWVKQADPDRPAYAQLFAATYQQDQYLPSCDVLINEVYPYDKVLMQAANFEFAQPLKYRAGDSPRLWAAVQASAWFEYSIHDEVRALLASANASPTIRTARLDLPTVDQLVCLALRGVTQEHVGAVFVYPASILKPDEAQKRWPIIKQAAAELTKLAPILAAPSAGDVASSTASVRCQLTALDGAQYLLAVNSSDSPQSAAIDLPQAMTHMQIISGDGQATLKGRQVHVQLAIWQSVVLKLNE